jgi:hypothetical protein
MNDKKNKLDGQINVFSALRGHDYQMVDWCQAMSKMMDEINYWRMVAKHPNAVTRPRGGQETAEMGRFRYQHMIGKAQSNISWVCVNLVEKGKLIHLEKGAYSLPTSEGW